MHLLRDHARRQMLQDSAVQYGAVGLQDDDLPRVIILRAPRPARPRRSLVIHTGLLFVAFLAALAWGWGR